MTDNDTPIHGFWLGFRDCVPVSIAAGLFGFVFGLLAHTKGISLVNAGFMSAVVFAGAAQTVSLSIWASHHIPLFSLLMTVFIICLRFFLMSATLRPILKDVPSYKVYLSLFFLADENWALTLMKHQKNNHSAVFIWAYYLGVSVIFYIAWLFSTLLGNYMATYISDPSKFGFEFAFIAIFLGLLIGMWRGKRDAIPWLIAAGSAIICAYFIPGNWYIMIGALAGSFAGVWRDNH